jgi:cyclophilin family peptidyl-prolyl cis-trans isomerase
MRKYIFAALVVVATIALNTVPVAAKERAKPVPAKVAPAPAVKAAEAPSPGEIVAAAPASDWTMIAPSDLLVMDLAADAKGKHRRVVIQLMPVPFSQGWIGNIRKLAAAHWWDGTSINRVQDNYVTQWGDATEKKALPDGLAFMPESAYEANSIDLLFKWYGITRNAENEAKIRAVGAKEPWITRGKPRPNEDPYADFTNNVDGWLIAGGPRTDPLNTPIWPVHCYAMVGVGRNLSPDTGTGAELYTVIGHAPRHLDRNIALVGRIIEGMEHMSSLPRGTGALGFYETPEERTGIVSVRLGGDVAGLPGYEYLSTESESFASYADARANRRDPFFIKPAGGADICNIPVPVRRRG